MKSGRINRRSFVKSTAALAMGLSIGQGIVASVNNTRKTPENKLPRWRGFNLLDYFNPLSHSTSDATTEEDFKWMSDWGFDFVRIPMTYPRYLNLNRSEKINAKDFYSINYQVVEEVEKLVYLAHKYNLHVSLNLHRAPGYCINAGFYEPYNLWKDKEARDAFNFHWGIWAERFKNVPEAGISFDLLNEPAYREDMNDQFSKSSALPGQLYKEVAQGAIEAIRKVNPDRIIIADGNNVGNQVTPELIDLNIGQSCRGYFPHYISHYQAPWVWKNPSDAPMPIWPGTIEGMPFNRQSLENYYKPWIELAAKGQGVHCGECGCWKNTPHEVFLAWFGDVIGILTENNIGYALWNFRGDFGILDSGRKDVEYTNWYGHKLDSKLLELLKKN